MALMTIEPPVKSSVRVKGFNGRTDSTMVGTVNGRSKMIMEKCITSYFQTHLTYPQLEPDYFHHNIGLKSERKEETHTV
jgi:hypothetical protein